MTSQRLVRNLVFLDWKLEIIGVFVYRAGFRHLMQIGRLKFA